jgi:hypothetical protein
VNVDRRCDCITCRHKQVRGFAWARKATGQNCIRNAGPDSRHPHYVAIGQGPGAHYGPQRWVDWAADWWYLSWWAQQAAWRYPPTPTEPEPEPDTLF